MENEIESKNEKGDFASAAKSLIFADETLDDLELDGLKIIQKKNGYKFSTDSVLLANFASTKRRDTLVDLCSGSGVVAILCSYKNHTKRTIMVEIQQEIADMARRTVELDGLKNIEVQNIDLADSSKVIGCETVDVVTVNPPYNVEGETSSSSEIAKSTHEISTNLFDVCRQSSKLLKFGGKFFAVIRADRIFDIFKCLTANNLEPKRLRFVYPKLSKNANLVLIEAKKGSKSGLTIEKPLILCNDDGTETVELKQIYGRH